VSSRPRSNPMKVSEVFKRQPKPKPERLVREGVMTPLCFSGSQIHAKHDFETPLSNYCQRCQLLCPPTGFHQPEDGSATQEQPTSTRGQACSCSSPAPATEPTSPTS